VPVPGANKSLGDAIQFGNAVADDQHILVDGKIDQAIVLGVAVDFELVREEPASSAQRVS
jgi:hypothetical protein